MKRLFVCKFVFGLLLICGQVSLGQTLYTVSQTNPASADFDNISDAMTAAISGDSVEVLDNAVYAEAVDYGGEDINLFCDPLDRATITPPAGWTTFLIDMSGGLSREAQLFGFTVSGATNGAINCSGSAPTINTNEIVGNSLPAGNFNSAGVTGVDSSPFIVRNIFAFNSVFENGGAIFLDGELDGGPVTVIRNNFFDSNTALDDVGTPFGRRGGAMHLESDTELGPVVIRENTFFQNAARGWGGAISLDGRPAFIINNEFEDNLMLFEPGDPYPCGSEISYGGGAISIVDVDYSISALTDNTYVRNVSDYDGGGIYLWNSVARIVGEDMQNCFSVCRGGGIFAGEGSLTLVDQCNISDDNFSGQGGGVAVVDDVITLVSNSEISRNGASVAGGGIYAENSEPTLVDLLIDSNGEDLFTGGFSQAPPNGGGIAVVGGSALVERCEIIRNVSQGNGGGVYAELVETDFTVLNCILGANIGLVDVDFLTPCLGAAMYVEYVPGEVATPFDSNTVARNRAEDDGFSGVYVASPTFLQVDNCIIWNNRDQYDPNNMTVTGVQESVLNPFLGSAGFLVNFTDIRPTGTFTVGAGNISVNPRFVSNPNANFRIRSNSPCIDVGDNGAPLISDSDIDNQARIINGTIDMGADEALTISPAGDVSVGG